MGGPTRFLEGVTSLPEFGSDGEFGLVCCWFVTSCFVSSAMGSFVYVDEMLKLDMIVCCRCCVCELSICTLYRLDLLFGFCCVSVSAAFRSAAIIVGFRLGAHII